MAFAGRAFVVTGGGGYFGARLCLELLNRGADEVRCFDVSPKPLNQPHQGTLTLVIGDVRDKAQLATVTRGADGVFHCASFGMSGKEMLQDAKVHSVNVDGTLALCEACLANGVQALVYTSTCNVVFGGQEIVNGDESLPVFPVDKHVDCYSPSKAVAENFVLHSNRSRHSTQGKGEGQGQLYTCALRPASIYGPGETRHFPRTMSRVRSGIVQFRVGHKSTRGDWVHVDNLVHAHCLAMAALLGVGDGGLERKQAVAGEAFFITDAHPMNNFDFLGPIVEAYGHRIPQVWIPVGPLLFVAWATEVVYRLCSPLLKYSWFPDPLLLPAEVYKVGVTHYFSVAKAESLLGYRPVISASDGIRQMQEYWRGVRSQEVPRPSLLECVLVLVGLLLFAVTSFTPRPSLPWILQPVQRLGLLLFMSRDIMQLAFWFAIAIHVAEGLFAAVLASSWDPSNTLEWFAQTSVFGFPSLRLLLTRIREKGNQ